MSGSSFYGDKAGAELGNENATRGTRMMDLRHKLPLITTIVIVTLIMATRFISSVMTNDIGGVDPRITLPPNQVQEILEQQ